jgi:hypothetical protein
MASPQDVLDYLLEGRDTAGWVFTAVELFEDGSRHAPFEHGEIVLLRGRFEREVFDERKPSKWDCHETDFLTLREAKVFSTQAKKNGPKKRNV